MATVMYIPEHRQNRFAMRAVINYCMQEYKTFDNKSKRQLISGVNCDSANAFQEFMATKKVYGKDNGFFFYHYAQSFSPKEKITPEQAHEIALEFAEKAWSGHEVLVTTHCDREHIHSHFVINSVGFESGKKLRQSPSTLKHLRKLSDEICIAHGFSVLQPYQGGRKSMSSREYRTRLRGNSWKEKLAKDIGTAMSYSGSKDEFIRNMSILGYHMTWTNERKKQPTGWEAFRELYEQHLKERAQSKTETQRIADSYSNVGNEISSLAGAVSKIVDNDSEDPDERRKRIEAEENGSTLGSVLGLGIGMIANAINETPEQELDYEQEEYKTREEILEEIFGADDYDYDNYDDSEGDDEDEEFSMTL